MTWVQDQLDDETLFPSKIGELMLQNCFSFQMINLCFLTLLLFRKCNRLSNFSAKDCKCIFLSDMFVSTCVSSILVVTHFTIQVNKFVFGYLLKILIRLSIFCFIDHCVFSLYILCSFLCMLRILAFCRKCCMYFPQVAFCLTVYIKCFCYI